jgi:hypothetical protein
LSQLANVPFVSAAVSSRNLAGAARSGGDVAGAAEAGHVRRNTAALLRHVESVDETVAWLSCFLACTAMTIDKHVRFMAGGAVN